MKTERDRQMALNKRRFKRELRKKGKEKGQSTVTKRGGYTPNLLAVHKPKKEKKK